MKHVKRLRGRTLTLATIAGSALLFGFAGGHAAYAAPRGVRSGGATAVAESIAQASGEQLTTGCNIVTLSNLTVGMKVADYVSQNVQPASAVISVWHYDNATQRYQADYFSDPSVPVDQPAFTASVDGFFFCVTANATAP